MKKFIKGDMQKPEDRIEILKMLAEGDFGEVYIEYSDAKTETTPEAPLDPKKPSNLPNRFQKKDPVLPDPSDPLPGVDPFA